jgi:diaminopimelate epimerase
MIIEFTKMQGTGNDFVLLDGIRYSGLFTPQQMTNLSKWLCDRRFGIGADQVLLLLPSDVADFRMDIYNADGSCVEMCGNGIRCVARYIWNRGYSDKALLTIETLAGIMRPQRVDGLVRVDMGEPVFLPPLIPVDIDMEPPIIDYPLQVHDTVFKVTCVSMGNPHAVIFPEEDIDAIAIAHYGPLIETNELFPKRTNVEFINVLDRWHIKMRVWERGSGETLACGTGASAATVASILKGLTERDVEVALLGGRLIVHWADNNHVYMTGPAEEVFQGRVDIDIH